MRPLRPFACVLFALAPALGAQSPLLVGSRNTDEILSYDPETGEFLGVFAAGGGLTNPVGVTFGPDGDLFVSSEGTDEVLRYDGLGGFFLGVFASGGGLDSPRQLNFGPDGHLYVASGFTDQILRYHGRTGAFLGVFAEGGNLDGPTSFTFGPDGDLFVVSVNSNRIKRYDGETGAYEGNFASFGLSGPHDLDFGPDGLLYVSNAFNRRVQRYDGETGAFVDVFIQDSALSAPLGLWWDRSGRLYVANQGRDEVRRYNGRNGRYIDSPVPSGAGGVSGPLFAAFALAPRLRVLPPLPGRAGRTNHLQVEGATPGAALILACAPGQAGSLLPACALATVLPSPELFVPRIADESGRALVDWSVPVEAEGVRYSFRALEARSCQATPVTSYLFPPRSSPPGAMR